MSLQEHKVKALYLFLFSQYVEWPESAAGNTNAFVIGVVGSPEVAAGLVDAARGKLVGGKPVVIRRFDVGADLEACQILYVGSTDRGPIERSLEKLGHRPVLTVGEGEGFLDHGGMVGFVEKDKKVRLLISLEMARRTGLRVSAKLLSVAGSVRDGKAR